MDNTRTIPRCWNQEQCLLDYASVFTSGKLRQAGIPSTVLEHHGLKYCTSITDPFINNPLLYFMSYVNDLLLLRHVRPYRMSLGRLKSIFLDEAMAVKCKHRTHSTHSENPEFLKPVKRCNSSIQLETESTPPTVKPQEEDAVEALTTVDHSAEENIPANGPVTNNNPEATTTTAPESTCGVETRSKKRKKKKSPANSSSSSPATKIVAVDTIQPTFDEDSSNLIEQSVEHETLRDYPEGDDHPISIGLRASEITKSYKLFGGTKALNSSALEELLEMEDTAGMYAAVDLLKKTTPCANRCVDVITTEGFAAWLMLIQHQGDPSGGLGERFKHEVFGCKASNCKLSRMLRRFLLGT